jgi:hypothetical protein
MVYQFIRENPDCITAEITSRTGANHQRISDLVHEGLVEVTGRHNGYRTYRIVPENATRRGRDRVQVEVTIYVNEFGEYFSESKVVGQVDDADKTKQRRLMMRKAFTVMVPMPEEIRTAFRTRDLQTSAREPEPLTIDLKAEDITPKK